MTLNNSWNTFRVHELHRLVKQRDRAVLVWQYKSQWDPEDAHSDIMKQVQKCFISGPMVSQNLFQGRTDLTVLSRQTAPVMDGTKDGMRSLHGQGLYFGPAISFWPPTIGSGAEAGFVWKISTSQVMCEERAKDLLSTITWAKRKGIFREGES